MDSWERFNETSLPAKKDFYSELTLEDISDKVMNMLKKCLKNIAKTWVIIMICMFKLIRVCLQIFLKNLEKNALNIWTWSFIFLFCTWISMESMFKKDRGKIELLTDIDMLLMTEKVLEEECANQHIDMLKQIISTWKIMIKKPSHHIWHI